jgi:hypothetical protein
VTQLGFGLLSLFLSLNATVPDQIERAFLQNSPSLLYALLSPDQAVAVSLPAPISFSDQLSNEQAFFLFQKIFRTHTTFEFFPAPGGLRSARAGRYVFKARWSFLNKNGNQDVFQIFFLIQARPGAARITDFWKIAEIKAEKLY